jgi:hypothetical protein
MKKQPAKRKKTRCVANQKCRDGKGENTSRTEAVAEAASNEDVGGR